MLKNYITLLDYNGHRRLAMQLVELILKAVDNDKCIIYPSELSYLDVDHPVHMLWSLLVLEYGDYGTSPRYGWLVLNDELIKTLNYIKITLEES